MPKPGPGSCTVTASQGGNANYNQAPPVARTFTIGDTTPPAIAKLTPTIGAVKRDAFPVSIAVSVTDTGDAAPACKISSVTSNATARSS